MRSIADLKNESLIKKLTVKWTVLCEIGPEWIGSRRTITFYLDNIPLEESEFQKSLTEKLIEIMNIPSKSEAHVINGIGTFNMNGSDLIIYYETESNIPYDMKFNYDNGERVFLKFS